MNTRKDTSKTDQIVATSPAVETVRRQFRDHVGNVHGLERCACAWSSNQQGGCLKILSLCAEVLVF